MEVAVAILGFIIILLSGIIIFIQGQIKSINKQLDKRLKENTRQPIYLELMNKELNTLAININKCFKAEELLGLKVFREEKQFKEMIANISHDLRTPLTAIKGYQQLIERGELSEDQRKRLKIAQKYGDELGSLIEHFFEYSYLLNANTEPNLEKINLTNLTIECLADGIDLFEKNNLKVEFMESPAVYILGDREMLIRILQNLIGNAVAYAKGDLFVCVEEKEMGALVFGNLVEKPNDVDVNYLFDRFYTSDKARGKTTGLGLSIVKLLTEKMNGEVQAFFRGDHLQIQIKLPLN